MRPLGPRTQQVLVASELFVSVLTFAEIGIKVGIGKLTAPPGLHTRLADLDVRVLPLTAEHGLGVAELPLHHRDPFDRLLISQAKADRLTLVSADRAFQAYDVGWLPADE